MRQTMVRVACSLAISWGLNAQAPAKFEVASVKVSEAPPGPIRGFGRANGGPDTTTPGQFTATGMSLKMLLFNYAFNFMDYQYSAPSWMEKEVYDVTAKVPPGVTRDQFRVMLRNLLIERFKIEVHHEQREMTTYDLVVAKSGLKMKPSKFDDNTPRDPGPGPGGSIHLEKDADGFPAIPESSGPMTFGTGMNGQLVWLTNKASIQQLIDVLERNVKVPISDQTGLKGNFACMLHFLNGAPAAGGAGSASVGSGAAGATALDVEVAPTVFTALQSQLGLKLEPHKKPVDVLVIDKAEKTPIEN